MNPSELAEAFESVARLLKEKGKELEGSPHALWVEEADGALRAVARLKRALQRALAEKDPEARAWLGLMQSPAARIFEDPEIFLAYARQVLRRPFVIKKKESLADARKRFTEKVCEEGRVERAKKLFSVFVHRVSAPPVDWKDQQALLRELYALGRLEDEEAEALFATRLKSKKLLRRMGEVAGLGMAPEADVRILQRKLLAYARNAYQNTQVFEG
jgi:hypothetical protein